MGWLTQGEVLGSYFGHRRDLLIRGCLLVDKKQQQQQCLVLSHKVILATIYTMKGKCPKHQHSNLKHVHGGQVTLLTWLIKPNISFFASCHLIPCCLFK